MGLWSYSLYVSIRRINICHLILKPTFEVITFENNAITEFILNESEAYLLALIIATAGRSRQETATAGGTAGGGRKDTFTGT